MELLTLDDLLPSQSFSAMIIREAAKFYARLSPSLRNLIAHKTDGADQLGTGETVIVILSGKPLKKSFISKLFRTRHE